MKSDYEVSPASYSFENEAKAWFSAACESFYPVTSSLPSSLAELSRHSILVLPTKIVDDVGEKA